MSQDKTIGRWDIDFIKKPKNEVTQSINNLTRAWLIAIAESYPEEWDELKQVISWVDRKVSQ